MEIETQSYITNLLKTNPKIVENNLNYNDKKFNKKKEYYQLKEHIDTFLEKESDDRFFIMPGLRGVGKTTIIYQLFSYLPVSYTHLDVYKRQFLDCTFSYTFSLLI